MNLFFEIYKNEMRISQEEGGLARRKGTENKGKRERNKRNLSI